MKVNLVKNSRVKPKRKTISGCWNIRTRS